MPVPENPQSYDPTGSEESTRVERFHRSAGFRYAAVVVCGIGLATASSTFLRLSQGWRDAPRPAAESAGGPVTTVATAPAPPLSTGLERHPTLPPEPEPARPAVQPAAPEPRMDFHAEAIAWWDRWLKEIENGAERLPAVRAYILDAIRPARIRRAFAVGVPVRA